MKTFSIQFNQDQMQILNDALIELPFKKSAPLIAHINKEIQKQFDTAKDDGPTGQVTPPDAYLCD